LRRGGSAGDSISLIGYGTAAQGASVTQLNATQWSINAADGTIHDIITLANGGSIDFSDITFIAGSGPAMIVDDFELLDLVSDTAPEMADAANDVASSYDPAAVAIGQVVELSVWSGILE